MGLTKIPDGHEAAFAFKPANSASEYRFLLESANEDYFYAEMEQQQTNLFKEKLSRTKPDLTIIFLNAEDPGYNGLDGALNYYLDRLIGLHDAPLFYLKGLYKLLTNTERKWITEEGINSADYLWLRAFQEEKLPKFSYAQTGGRKFGKIVDDMKRINSVRTLRFERLNEYKKIIKNDPGNPELNQQLVKHIIQRILKRNIWYYYIYETD
ncbi:MAG TPA: hypothetical protein VFE53_03235 [Mucilaginibacter sp.]|nr:hypothetical protein [Mucilaginibacter sp.]